MYRKKLNMKMGTFIFPIFLSISIIFIANLNFLVESHGDITIRERSYDLRISGWTFPWDNSSFESLREWGRDLDEVSPYWYYTELDGKLVPSHNNTEDSEYIDHCSENGVKIIPMISNNHDMEIVSNIINDSTVRENHIQELLEVTIENGYKGVDINYENIPTALKDGFSLFIDELSMKFHENNKLVYVSVFPKISDDENREGPGAYDYERIGASADSVRVMAYNLHWSSAPRAGPITSFDWLEEVMQYSVSSIPKHKISLGIPLFGYDWIVDRKGNALSIADNRSFEYIENLLNEPGIVREWNGTSRTPFLRYSDPSGILHEIDYNDAESLLHELLIVRDLGISRISLWRLGNEDPQVMDYLIRIQKNGLSNLPPYINIGQDKRSMKGTSVDLGPIRAYDVDGVLTSAIWDFGDGNTSGLIEPVHIFTKGGSYDSFLTVVDDKGSSVTYGKNILVGPFSWFSVEGQMVCDKKITFDARGSWDLENIVSYSWEMGDGTYFFHSGPKIEYFYSRPGNFPVTLTVINNKGFTDTSVKYVNIPDITPPVIISDSNIIVWEDMEISFDGRGSFDDSGVINLSWFFHDGSQIVGNIAEFIYTEPGTYNVTLQGEDPSGQISTKHIRVRVKDRTPPILVADFPPSVSIGEQFLLDISKSTDNVAIENITWKLPSGKMVYDKLKLNYSTQHAGTYHFTVDILDSEGNWNSTTLKIEVIDNFPPEVEILIDPAPANRNATYVSKTEIPYIYHDNLSPDLFFVVNVTYRFLLTDLNDSSEIGYINWSFGDGSTAFGGAVYHNYSRPGEYRINLDVDDIHGNRFNRNFTVIVLPTVNFTLNPVQTYQTIFENRTNLTDKDEDDDIPLIAGISAIIVVLVILTILVFAEVRLTVSSIFRKKGEEGGVENEK
jgi:spore germination protein YaaH/PKD repeat protein